MRTIVYKKKKRQAEKFVLDGTRTHNLWLTRTIKAPEANALSIRPQGRHYVSGAKIDYLNLLHIIVVG